MKPDLRSTLQRLAPAPERTLDVSSLIREGRKRRQTRYVAYATATLTIAAVAAIATTAVFRGGMPDRNIGPVQTPRAPSSAPSWTTYESEDHDFTVSYPSDWMKADRSLTPNLQDPTEIFSVGTFSLKPGPSECAQFAGHAMHNMDLHDALVSFQESLGPLEGRHVIDRPETTFSLKSGYPTEAQECEEDPTPFVDRLIPFTYGDRSFYAYAAWGESASSATKEDVLGILDSFEVTD